MIYKAFLKQCGGGCDYTIGCAQIVINIDAQNIDEAKQKLYHEIKENYTGDRELEYCELYEINDIVVCELKIMYDNIKNDLFNIKEQQKELIERQEYERLKAKFSNEIKLN